MKTQPLIQTGQGSYAKRIYPHTTWTKREDEIVRQVYPLGGAKAVQVALKKEGFEPRSLKRIFSRANVLKVKRNKKQSYEDRVASVQTDSLHHCLHGLIVAMQQTFSDLQKFMERFEVIARTITERTGSAPTDAGMDAAGPANSSTTSRRF